MNRYKKEQMKKKKADPNYREPEGRTLSDEEWNRLINYYEDTNRYERMAKTFPGPQRDIDERSKELEKEADEERRRKLAYRSGFWSKWRYKIRRLFK